MELPKEREEYTKSYALPEIKCNLKHPTKFCPAYMCTDIPEKRNIRRPSNVSSPFKQIELENMSETGVKVSNLNGFQIS